MSLHNRLNPIKAADAQSIQAVLDARERGFRFFNRAINNRHDVRAADNETVIDIYDEIGWWGISAKYMREKLNTITTPTIRLRMNSPGGDAFDGIAIYNDLLNHPAEVIVEVSGVAASAASVIAMAGDKVFMADSAFLMIHNAWGIAIGDKNLMADYADLLATLDGSLALTYTARTKIEQKAILKMMDETTWLDAATAREKGFADAAPIPAEPAEAEALFDLSVFDNIPKALRERYEERLHTTHNHSRREARSLASFGFTKFGLRGAPEPVNERVAEDRGVNETAAAFQSFAELVNP